MRELENLSDASANRYDQQIGMMIWVLTAAAKEWVVVVIDIIPALC